MLGSGELKGDGDPASLVNDGVTPPACHGDVAILMLIASHAINDHETLKKDKVELSVESEEIEESIKNSPDHRMQLHSSPRVETQSRCRPGSSNKSACSRERISVMPLQILRLEPSACAYLGCLSCER